jgi:hypothetical protein
VSPNVRKIPQIQPNGFCVCKTVETMKLQPSSIFFKSSQKKSDNNISRQQKLTAEFTIRQTAAEEQLITGEDNHRLILL